MNEQKPMDSQDQAEIAKLLRQALVIGLILLTLWLAGRIMLLIFAGALFAVLLNALARLTGRRIGLPRNYALLVVSTLIALLLSASIYFLLPRIVAQSSKLIDRLSASFDQISQYVAQYFPQLHVSIGEVIGASSLPLQMFGFTSSLSAGLVTIAIILFVGFYGAIGSSVYRNGLLRLFPPERREAMDEILTLTGGTLEWWLLGRAITMASVGVLTLAGLLVFHIPLAAPLSLIAALLTFIPFLGAIISAIPAVLIAFVQGPLPALFVILVYTGAHIVEAYLIAPLVQKRTVHLPPVLMLSAQAILGYLFGVIGLALAAPLAAIGMVLVRTLYLQETPQPSGAHVMTHRDTAGD